MAPLPAVIELSARLERADGQLVAPVDRLLVRSVRLSVRRSAGAGTGTGGLQVANLAAGVADVRVVERAHQRPGGVRLPQRVGVGERDDLAAGPLHGGVLRADLAAARQLEHEVGAGVPGARGGRVGAAVARDDHLESLARIVEAQRVGDLLRDHRLLVVGGDDHRQRRERDAAGSAAPRVRSRGADSGGASSRANTASTAA